MLKLNGFLGAKKMVYTINSSIVILLIMLGRGIVSNTAAMKYARASGLRRFPVLSGEA
jgi:hypothetical protein